MDTGILLGRYRPQGGAELRDVERVRALMRTAADPWLRSLPLHLTASALVVHPDSGRVLLRWSRDPLSAGEGVYFARVRVDRQTFVRRFHVIP